ncbi:MAG: ABC transporter ATP-binding protein [Bacteroidales bacterium]|nr:ABC transporter ATP-binding protein [Bacteroidales bacterium]
MHRIEIEHIDFQYNQQPIFQDLSVTFEEGEFCAVVGPNGSGKTTLLKCMAGLLNPTSGRIQVGARDIYDYSPIEFARNVSFVPQHQDTIFDLSVYEMVLMGRNPYQKHWQMQSAEDEAIVMQMLEKCHIAQYRDRNISALSGGELQRTLIARAMAQQTPIMLLDEPLSNLDVSHKFEIMDILAELNEVEKVTIVIVIHDFTMAIEYAHQALLMRSGRVLAHDEAHAVLTPENLRKCFCLDDSLLVTNQGLVTRIAK